MLQKTPFANLIKPGGWGLFLPTVWEIFNT